MLQALERYRPSWVEDPLRPDAVEALDRLAAEVAVPIATGESLRAAAGSCRCSSGGRSTWSSSTSAGRAA